MAGHDIGLMVAYAYAARYSGEVDRLALMDAFIPGVGDTTGLFLLKDLWHFHFYGPTPLALVKGRERIYFEHFWNDFAADGKKSVSEADRRFYAQKYAQPGAMKAGMVNDGDRAMGLMFRPSLPEDHGMMMLRMIRTLTMSSDASAHDTDL